MNSIKYIYMSLLIIVVTGCTSTSSVDGPGGPKVVSSGRTTESGSYAEVGVQFTSLGDFVAVISPNRWKNPVETGGSLSWINPVAWNDDAGRTGRILLGEAALLGGVAIAATSSSDGGSSAGGNTAGGGGTPPPPTGGGGGGTPPPTPGGL